MGRSRIGVKALVCVLGYFLLVSTTAFGEIVVPLPKCLFGLSLKINVLPNGTYNPLDICESRPLNLEFTYNRCLLDAGTYSLHSLEYWVFNEDENAPFFKDILNLTDNTLPNAINVSPGIYIPPDSTKIRVKAMLAYSDSKRVEMVEWETEENIKTPMSADWINQRTYDRMRDGYIRRHLLDAGRGLSDVWLKEYEPSVDSKELLRLSRTEKVAGQTRVYVPWISKCTGDQTGLGHCGSSVGEQSSVIYGGDENPLLRGGLAMATFALEYLAHNRNDSLKHAMKLFEYVEKSEWRNPANGQLTGFFLRSRWPGNQHKLPDDPRQYWFASVDELAGMSLGMVYLTAALYKYIWTHALHLDSPEAGVLLRIAALTDRLGNQLRNNFYLILPVKRDNDNNTWVPIGLPLEKHRGWAGAYPFQWFFSRGFKYITGNDYTVPSDLFGSLGQFQDAINLPLILDALISPLDQAGGATIILESLEQQLSPYDLAVGSIQGLGIGMYHSGEYLFQIQIPIVGLDWTINFPTIERYNYAMLLHVFQLGMMDPYPVDEAYVVKQEMSRLIKGVISGGEKTKLLIPPFFKSPLINAISFITQTPPPLIDWALEWLYYQLAPDVWVGGPKSQWEQNGTAHDMVDLYSAAIAVAYNLPGPYYQDTSDYWTQINSTLYSEGPSRWWQNLPLGDRGLAPGIDHNPNQAWGSSFCFEHFGPWIYGGGNDESEGLPNSLIEAYYKRSPKIDSMLEGAGLDFLLPWSLIYALAPGWDQAGYFLPYALNYSVPYLQACTTNPVSLALAEQGRADAWFFNQCSFTYSTPTYKISGGAYTYHSPTIRSSFSLDVTGPVSPSGWLKYYYTQHRMYFVSTGITSVSLSCTESASCNIATISGTGAVNGVGGYTFTATVTNGLYGSPDSFGIVIKKSDGTISFSTAGANTISGGDLVIQIL